MERNYGFILCLRSLWIFSRRNPKLKADLHLHHREKRQVILSQSDKFLFIINPNVIK